MTSPDPRPSTYVSLPRERLRLLIGATITACGPPAAAAAAAGGAVTAAGLAGWLGVGAVLFAAAVAVGLWTGVEAPGRSNGPFQPLADEAPVMLWVADARGHFTFVNRAFQDFTGVARGGCLGERWQALAHPADREAVGRVLTSAVETRTEFQCEVRLRRADGYYRTVALAGRPLGDDAGLCGFVGSAADVTENRQAVEVLAVSERRLQDVLANAPVILFALGPDGVVTLSEGRGLGTLGQRRGEAVGRPAREVLGGFPELVRAADRALAGEPVAAELDLGGAVFDVWTSQQRGPAAGRPGEVTMVGVDVTPRVRAERAARERERLLTIINRFHVRFAQEADPQAHFSELLADLLVLTGSEYGFVGEIVRGATGTYLKTLAISDIAWDDATRDLYRTEAGRGMEFRNLDTLFGAVIRTGRQVVANDPGSDPRRGGLPPGHPPLYAFLGLPFGPPGQINGMVGLANRPGGYADADADAMEPLLAACGVLVEAHRARRDREDAVASLMDQMAHLQSLSEASPDGILVVDPAQRVRTYNRRFIEMWNIPRQVVEARDDERVLATGLSRTADPEGFLARVREIYADPALIACDEVPMADGRTFERHTGPVRGADGADYGRVWFFRDVTARKLAEEDLARLALIARSTTNAVILTDPHARIEWVNEAFTRVTGYTTDEVLGKKPGEILQGRGTDPATVEFMRSRLRAGQGFNTELLNYRKSGEAYWLEIEVQPIRDAEGAVTRYMAVEQDITGRKQAELEPRDQTVRLEEQTRLAALRAEVGMALNLDAPLPDVLRRCCGVILTHTGAAFVRAWTLNEPERVLELRASVGMYAHTNGPHGRIPVGAFKIGRIAETREPVLTNEVIGDRRIPDQEWAAREGMVAFAGHPLVCEDRVVGVLALFARHALNPATLDALGVAAGAVALGVVRMQAEAALRASEVRQRAIIDSSNDCIVSADESGLVVEFNPAAEVAFRLPRAGVIGRPIRWLIAADAPVPTASVTGLSHLVEPGHPALADLIGPRREGRATRADGSTFPIDLTVVRTAAAAGRVTTVSSGTSPPRRRRRPSSG